MASSSVQGSRLGESASFRATLDTLARDLPQMKHSFEASHSRGSLMTVHDYGTDWEPTKPAMKEDLTHEFVVSLRRSLSGASTRRVTIIEDLCHDLALALTQAFDLSSEVCEDYLVNSGWDELGRYVDEETDHWRTRRVRQEHVTLRWYRPCELTLRRLSEESLELSRESILRQSRREVCTYTDSKGRNRIKPVQHDLSVATNVWRHHLDLRTNKEGPFHERDRLAWEERTTIWQRKEEDGLYGKGYYLGTSNKAPVFEDVRLATSRLKTSDESTSAHAVTTSALSHSPIAGSQTNLSDGQYDARPANDYDADDDAINPIPPRTPAVQRSGNRQAIATSRQAKDVPSVDVEMAAIADEAARKWQQNTSKRVMTSRSGNRPTRLMTMVEAGVVREEVSQLYAEASPNSTTRLGSLLKNVASRGPTATFSLVPSQFHDTTFQALFQQTTSTVYDLELWMGHDVTKRNQSLLGLGPVSAIFNIIGNDIEDFLHLYEDTLDSVQHLSLNQTTVEKMLPSWRNLMNHLGNELRYLESRLPTFAAFIALNTMQPQVTLSTAGGRVIDPAFDIEGVALPQLMRCVRRLQERTQHSSDALVVSVSFLESRRGIDEAQSVTRLTQLAFAFIPISFAASFYGMQVKEFNPLPSIWQFFTLTAGLMLTSYSVVFFQSSYFKDFLARHQDEIRRFADVRQEVRFLSKDDRLKPGWVLQYL